MESCDVLEECSLAVLSRSLEHMDCAPDVSDDPGDALGSPTGSSEHKIECDARALALFEIAKPCCFSFCLTRGRVAALCTNVTLCACVPRTWIHHARERGPKAWVHRSRVQTSRGYSVELAPQAEALPHRWCLYRPRSSALQRSAWAMRLALCSG